MAKDSQKQLGFTLVELVIVLIILGIFAGMGLKMTSAILENAATSDTRAKQERIKVALVSYLRTNRRLPCPASTPAVPTGSELSACATTVLSFGVVPWVSLNIPRDTAIDGWGNFISYKVQPAWAALASLDMNQVSSPSAAVTIQEVGAPVTPNAVVVLISHGPNGFGAATTKAAGRMVTTGATAEEIANAAETSTSFHVRPAAANVALFDDAVSYLLPQDLFGPLIAEGSLKTCRAYCAVSSCYMPNGSVNGPCNCLDGQNIGGISAACVLAGGACGMCQQPPTGSCNTAANVVLPIGHSPAACL